MTTGKAGNSLCRGHILVRHLVKAFPLRLHMLPSLRLRSTCERGLHLHLRRTCEPGLKPSSHVQRK